MSSVFCSLEEAFTGPIIPGKRRKEKRKEGVVPGLPESTADVPEPMVPSPPDQSASKPEAATALNDFFPIPGESADWEKAFTLEGSGVPLPRPDGSVSVAGKSTLWRKVPAPVVPAPVASDIHQRLDALTRQLESLTGAHTSNPVNSTAEIFLFIAIGLLFILAIDTLLRCATSIVIATRQRGGYSLRRRWRG